MSLQEKGLRPFITNWDELAAYFVNQLTSELAANPYNSIARDLLAEVRSYPGIPDPFICPTEFKPYLTINMIKGDLSLDFFTMVSTFGTPQDVTLQEIRIETFFPANSATEAFVKAL